MASGGLWKAAGLDLALVAGLGAAVAGLLWVVDLEALQAGRSDMVPGYSLTDLLILLVFLVTAFAYYSLRRAQDLRVEARGRQRAETVLREASGLVASLVEAQRRMGESEDALGQFFATTAAHVAQLADASGASIETLSGQDLLVQAAVGDLAPYAGQRRPSANVAGAQVVQTGEVWVGPAAEGASSLVLPMRVGQHPVGVIRLVHPEAGRFGPTEAAALRPVAEFVAYTTWNQAEYRSRRSVVDEHRAALQEAATVRRWLDGVAEATGDVVRVTSPDLEQTLYVEGASEAVLGRALEDFARRPALWTEIITEQDRDRVRAVRSKPEGWPYEVTYRVARGKDVAWVRERGHAVRDDAGALLAVAATLRDVSEAEGLASEAAALKRRWEFPYTAGPVVAYAARPSGDYGIVFVTPNVTKVLGFDPKDVTGDPNYWTARLHPEDQSRVFAQLPRLFEAGHLVQEYRLRHRDGEWRTVKDSMRLVRDGNGQPLEIIGYWEDVTASRRAEEGLNYSLSRIKELQESRTQLLNTIAHDLASPLSPILLQLTILRKNEEAMEERVRTGLTIIERNAKHVKMLVQDLKDLARLEAGRLKLAAEQVDLVALAKEAVESFAEAYKAKGVRLDVKLATTLPTRADPQRINQILFNFLTNALKFTPEGGRVRVEASSDRSGARLAVRDSGRGLNAEEIGKLFKPFSQVHAPKEVKERGTGLGLFICKGIAEAHGGNVGVKSDGHGKGSTFFLVLPAADAKA